MRKQSCARDAVPAVMKRGNRPARPATAAGPGSTAMQFRLRFPLEVQCPDGAGETVRKIHAQLVYQHGKWRAQSTEPPFASLLCDSMEEAIIALAKEVGRSTAPAPALDTPSV